MSFDRTLIDEYERGGEVLRRGIAGLSRDDLLAHPIAGTWSIQQIVLHLMDSDLIWTDRAKRVIAEENPVLIGYDESKFAANLHYDQQSADSAVTIFDLNRRLFATVLRKLPEAAFERTGTHNEVGKVVLGSMVRRITDHVEHHMKFLREKRAKLGK
jgi:uncharacterized damage-inducible protein DinB